MFLFRTLFLSFLVLSAAAQDQAAEDTPQQQAAEGEQPAEGTPGDAGAGAQEAADVPSPLDGIEVSVAFPDVDGARFELGQVHDMLIGFKNGANEPLNITSVQASLQSPFDLNYFIQNFTALEVGLIVQPGDTASILYRYAPYTSLDPMTFHLSAVVVYHTSEKFYVSPAYNQTIELYEAASTFNPKKFFSYGFGTVLYVAMAVALFQHTILAPASKKARKTKSAGAAVAPEENEWLPKSTQRRSSGKRQRK